LFLFTELIAMPAATTKRKAMEITTGLVVYSTNVSVACVTNYQPMLAARVQCTKKILN
jgi:hypothetical protein